MAGITKDEKSYGKSPSWWKVVDWRLYKIPEHLANWAMRGSYGPKYAMEDNVISGWGPNITHSYSMGKEHYRENGAGTSSTTPQAAAAASLWLNYNYPEFTQPEWRGWRKVEAVYQSMIRAARSAEGNFPIEMFGDGPLKAMDMMKISYKDDLKNTLVKRKPSKIGFRWLYDIIVNSNFIKVSGSQKSAHIEMIVTELMQNIAVSDRYTRAYNKVKGEKCKMAFNDLLEMLENDRKMKYSLTLGSAIKVYKNKLLETR